MRTQEEKGRLFRQLHQRPGILILPNPWDAGTAKLLASVGFEALATTSLGMSNALGRVDGEGSVSRAELLENCRIIAEATDLPVNADLENGYADDPKEAATILRDAAEMGIVGGSIEDWSGERIYDFHHAVERVAAGVEMARTLPVPFTFVARAENLIRGRPDLDDTIKRLQAFANAGADVLYAPGLRDLETMRRSRLRPGGAGLPRIPEISYATSLPIVSIAAVWAVHVHCRRRPAIVRQMVAALWFTNTLNPAACGSRQLFEKEASTLQFARPLVVKPHQPPRWAQMKFLASRDTATAFDSPRRGPI